MGVLLNKLSYKAQSRIAVINCDSQFVKTLAGELKEAEIDTEIDTEIDQKFLYDFMIFFVTNRSEIDPLVQKALHNISPDGVLWFCYPNKTSKRYTSDIDWEHGWEALNKVDYRKVRIVSVDENWTALRFRSSKFIKTKNR
jgi:hypothetical protein